MERPKVSVIVPVYNTEKYLRKCLDSLVGQSLQAVEVVAVDDGSKDSSGAILDEYKEKYPDKFVVVHKENGGQASARNLALTMCRGEYIGFLDSDDFVKEQMFERMYRVAKEQDADYVACGYTDITYQDDKEVILQEYVASKPAKENRDMFFGALVSPFLHLYKKELFDESGVMFPEKYIYEDTAFYLNLIPYVKRIVTIEESLSFRVRHSNSTTTTFKKERVRNILPVIQYSLDFYHKNGFYKKYEKELTYFCVKVLLCSSMQRVSRLESYQDAKELAGETLRFIEKNFPNFQKNPYFKGGMTNLYMKSFHSFSAGIYLAIFRFLNKFRRVYS